MAALLVKPSVYYASGLYQRVWRYAGMYDLLSVTMGVTVASAVLAVVVSVAGIWFEPLAGVSRAVLVVDWLLSIAVVGGARLSIRVLAESLTRRGEGGVERRRKRAHRRGGCQHQCLRAQSVDLVTDVGGIRRRAAA